MYKKAAQYKMQKSSSYCVYNTQAKTRDEEKRDENNNRNWEFLWGCCNNKNNKNKSKTTHTKNEKKNDENKTYRKFNAQPHKWLLNRHFFSV